MRFERRPRTLICVLAATLATGLPFAHAQFSLTPQATARPPGGGDPRQRREDPPDYRQYDYGREVFAVKLACTECPFGDRPLDERLARRFLADETIRFSLSREEEEAVTVFLKQRFALP